MTIEKIIKKLPQGYAADIAVNMAKFFPNKEIEGLTTEQLYGIALTAGYYLKNEILLNCIRAEAKLYLEEPYANACKIAVVLMAMNNTYYNFAHDMAADDEIKEMSTGLQMDLLQNHGITPHDFEVFCLAASILRGCEACVLIHTRKLLKRNMSKVALRNVARIVSVFRAAADAFEIEHLRSYDFTARGPSL